jgi:hypothetical protein
MIQIERKSKWTLRSGNNNSCENYRVIFSFNASADFLQKNDSPGALKNAAAGKLALVNFFDNGYYFEVFLCALNAFGVRSGQCPVGRPARFNPTK